MAGTYYPSICNNVPDYNCDPCEAQELGRIRNAGFIAKDWTFVDETDPAEWADGINQGKIFVIPETHGELPEPSPKMSPGFGNTIETLTAFDFAAKIFAKNFANNCEFWNEIKKSQNFYFYYSTSSKTYISTNTVTVIPSYTIPDDLTALVNWGATVKWQAADLPCPFTTPADVLTDCFDVA
jgi:hypothetical protein